MTRPLSAATPFRVAFLAALLLPAAGGQIAVLSRAGIEVGGPGAWRLVPGTEGDDTFCCDAEGRHLLVTRDGALFRVAIASGERQKIAGGFRRLRFPDVSPDGRRVAFAAQHEEDPGRGWKVYVAGADGEGLREIAEGYDPCFSFDGRRLYFERFGSRTEIAVLAFESGTIEAVATGTEDAYTVEAAPDAHAIAFSSGGRLHLLDLAGGGRSCLSPEGVYDRFAAFGADGRSLLFFREDRSDGATCIVSLDRASGEEQVVHDREPLLAACAPWEGRPAPRTLADFERVSLLNRHRHRPEELVRLDRRLDRALFVDVQEEIRRLQPGQRQRMLFLNGVVALDAAQAAALAASPASALFLPDLAALAPEAARALAGFGGGLFLDGLRTLDAETARALSRWRAHGEQDFLGLCGLERLEPETAAALSACEGWGLALNGIRALDARAARALDVSRMAWLDLDGLERVDGEVARAMGAWEVKFLSLGRAALDPESRASIERGCELLLGVPRSSPAPSMPEPCHEAQAVGEGGLLYVLGGQGEGEPLARLDAYDPRTGVWTRRAPMTSGRSFFAAVAGGGRLYAIGGAGVRDGPSPLSSVERYDPEADRWAPVAELPFPRTHAAAAAHEGRIWLAGGYARDRGMTERVDIYDPKTDSWSAGPPLPLATHGHALAVLDGRLHLVGGGFDDLRKHLVLDGGRWTPRAPLPSGRLFASAVACEGRLFVIGGSSDEDGGSFRSVLVYDPLIDTWSRGADAPRTRYHAKAALLGGIIFAVGGLDPATSEPVATIDRYEPAIDVWH